MLNTDEKGISLRFFGASNAENFLFYLGALSFCEECFFMSGKFAVAKRLAFDAAFVALYFVLSNYLSLPIGWKIKLTFDGLPIILCTLFLGLPDGLTVAAVGSFLSQATAYGISAAAPLWMLAAIGRAAVVGITVIITEKIKGDKIGKVGIVLTVIFSSLFVTAINTVVQYVDSCIIFNYGSLSQVFGWLLVARILSGVLSAAAYSLVIIPSYNVLSEFFGKIRHPENREKGELKDSDDRDAENERDGEGQTVKE